MRPGEFYKSDHHRWALGVIMALLLQVVAFSYWAGTLKARVDGLTSAVEQLQREFTAALTRK
jgi:hypothetical protein